MSDTPTGITIDDVRQGVADCSAAGRRPGMRPVWRAIVERTGRRPSFSTVARLLAEITDQAPATATDPAGPPDQVIAQLQQLAPAMWQAAMAKARQDLAAELQSMSERLQRAAERERELLSELDEVQARATTADEQRLAAEQRCATLNAHLQAQTAAIDTLAASHRSAAEACDQRERQLQARSAQLERETATLAATAHQAHTAVQTLTIERDRLRDDLTEAQRRADADLALNAHLHEQLDLQTGSLASMRREIDAANARAYTLELRLATREAQIPARDPLIRSLTATLKRLERQITRPQGSSEA